jgi:hypothetical protein
MPKKVSKNAEDKLDSIVLMSLAAAEHFELNTMEHFRTLSKKQFAEALNNLNEEQKIIANYFIDLPNYAAKDAELLIEEFKETFDLENEYDDLYKVVDKKRVKYAKEYNDNEDDDERHVKVVQSVKKDFIAAQKKPIKKVGAVKRNAAQASGSSYEQDLKLQIANLQGQVGKISLLSYIYFSYTSLTAFVFYSCA